MERNVLIGRYTDQRGTHLTHNVNVTVGIEEKEPNHENPEDRKPVISISGDCNGHMGQCQDEIRRLIDRITWAPAWSRERAAQLLDVWERWHLNDLRPGCEHQRAEGWDKRPIDPSKPLDAYGKHVPGKDAHTWNMLTWITPVEHPDGLLGKPCPTCGYKYGSAWIYELPPPEVLAFIEKIIRDDRAVSGRSALEDFIVKNGITCKAAELQSRADAADWPAGSRHYRVTLTNEVSGVTMTVSPYTQGPAFTTRPKAKDVLACVGRDVLDVASASSFEDWARSIGLDVDSRKAFRAWEKIKAQTDDLKALAGDRYRELLSLCEGL